MLDTLYWRGLIGDKIMNVGKSNMRSEIGCKILLICCFFSVNSGSVSAQESSFDEEKVGLEIIEQATSLDSTLKQVAEQLGSLPEDMAGAPEVFDEMIAAVEKVADSLKVDSEVSKGVDSLKVASEKSRDRWRVRCEETSNSRDCERIELWNERVNLALTDVRDLEKLRSLSAKEIERLKADKFYVVDDMQLKLWDTARSSLRSALDKTSEMVSSIEGYGTQVIERTRTGN